MGKYFRSSFYYPDDKDIYDFLTATNAPSESMLSFLRGQGIFAAESEAKEQLAEYVSLLYLSWESAEQLVDSITIRESDEAKASANYPWAGDFSRIRNALQRVEDRRTDRDRETYSIDGNATSFTVKVHYIEVETGKTRLLQEREKDLVIEIEKTTDGFKVRYDNVVRAVAIIQNLLGELPQETESPQNDISPRLITLAGITTAQRRVNFFKYLTEGVQGVTLREVTHIRVDRLDSRLTPDDEPEDEIEEALEKAVFYGKRLWQTPEFQALVEKGFFVTQATWRAELDTAGREHVEMSAGFNDAGECIGFNYRVLGIYKRDEEGDLRNFRERLLGSKHKELLLAIEAAALSALEAVTREESESTNRSSDAVVASTQTDSSQ